jgi:NAD(P)-dependent dehydrogenase (short-subunit alcohol dehydrogenase family)
MGAEWRHLSGKIAWVTGSSRGMGRAIAAHLASCGATMVVYSTTLTSTCAFNEAEVKRGGNQPIGSNNAQYVGF